MVLSGRKQQKLQALNPSNDTPANGVDQLRYLLIASQVELLDSPEAVAVVQYNFQSDNLSIGVVAADGKKCDRCWRNWVIVL